MILYFSPLRCVWTKGNIRWRSFAAYILTSDPGDSETEQQQQQKKKTKVLVKMWTRTSPRVQQKEVNRCTKRQCNYKCIFGKWYKWWGWQQGWQWWGYGRSDIRHFETLDVNMGGDLQLINVVWRDEKERGCSMSYRYLLKVVNNTLLSK
jgi:hypothetical protein